MTQTYSRRRALGMTAALPLLAGCATLNAIGDATEPRAVFELQPPRDIPRRGGRPLARDVIVEVPTVSATLATERILIRPNRLEAAYLPGVQWAEAAPVSLQTLVVRSLDATNAFQYVGRRPLGPGGDFALVSDLVAYEAELGADAEQVEVYIRLLARLVREDGIRLLSTRSFETRQPAASLGARDVVNAFDAAMGRLLLDLTGWVVSTLR